MKTIAELRDEIPVVDTSTRAFWEAVNAALRKYGCTTRMIKAVNLINDGKVKMQADGKTALVYGSEEFPYTVQPNGVCNCLDSQTNDFTQWFCKHAIGTGIIRKARKLYAQMKFDQTVYDYGYADDELYAVMG